MPKRTTTSQTSQMTVGTRRKRYRVKIQRPMKRMIKYKPRVDQVITRTFKYIFRPNVAPPEFTNQADCFIGNIKNGFFTNAYLFNIVDVPGLKSFVGPEGPFTHYRVDEITYKFIAVGTTAIIDDTDSGGTVQIQKTQPLIYYSTITGAERQGEIYYQSEDQAVFDSVKNVKCGQDFKLKFVPNSLTYLQSQRESTGAAITNPVLLPKKGMWCGDRFNYIIGTSPSLGTNFYGFKILVGNSNSEDGEYLYKVYVSLKVSFKGQSDNANQQITATGGFNHRVFVQ